MIEPEEAEVAAWLGARSERMIETACARVFLAGEVAYKVKRRVSLGYLDYSTHDLRHWALDRELSFNRAAAPDIYRSVRRLTRIGEAGIEFDGPGELVDWVLEMRRFDEHAVLAAQPYAVDGPLAEALGRTVAAAHATAPRRPLGGGAAALKYTIDSNAHLLGELASRLGVERVERLIRLTEAAFHQQAALLDHRKALGFARQCHADLHLGNILVEDGRPILFDCIEFNDVLSDIDIQYDIAFLLMDLDFRRRRDAGVRVLSAYLDEAGRHFDEGLREGLAALPLMLSVRAAVRAHVSAHSSNDAAAIDYVDAAIAHLAPSSACLVAVGGLSGSGKSTFARLIAPGLGASPGAVVLRTDETRKRLAGVPSAERLDATAYTASATDQVYEAMFHEACVLLAAGRAVVLDATFLSADLRARAEALATTAGVTFRGVWLDAPPEVLATRIEGRSDDASDATLATLERQTRLDVGQVTWPRIDATGPAEDSAQAWVADPAQAL